MPGLARLERDIKGDPPVGIVGREIGIQYPVYQLSPKILIVIGIGQCGVFIIPLRCYTAAADKLKRMHFEQVGEIGAKSDFKIKCHLMQSVIGDVQIFMDPFSYRPRDGQPQAFGEDVAVFRHNGGVGKNEALGVITHRA